MKISTLIFGFIEKLDIGKVVHHHKLHLKRLLVVEKCYKQKSYENLKKPKFWILAPFGRKNKKSIPSDAVFDGESGFF